MNEQTIEKDGQIYAKVFRAEGNIENGMHFLTGDEDPLQVGIFEREKGYEVIPHKHNPRTLDLESPGEFIWFQSGSAKVEILDDDWSVIGEVTVTAGDCLVIMKGGHTLTMLEPVRMLEVKQGPYPGREIEKTFRDPQ
tara:strand:- start:2328 stop:2741 length:414 start_codon:yes stop_codon:yes gene_type:complete